MKLPKWRLKRKIQEKMLSILSSEEWMKAFLCNLWNIWFHLFQKKREQNPSSHTYFMSINENEYWNQLMFKTYILFSQTNKILKNFKMQTSMLSNLSRKSVSQTSKISNHDSIIKTELLLTWSNKSFQTRIFIKQWSFFNINKEISTQNFIMIHLKIQILIWKPNILIYGTSCSKWMLKVQKSRIYLKLQNLILQTN